MKFGSFFKAGAPVCPAPLIGLSIRNRLTLGSRIQIEIMKLLAERYKSSNPGAKTQVINYASRPTMKLTPPQDATDRRPLHFTYVKAVTKLPVDFSLEELTPIYRMANSTSELTGKLRSTFVVLCDDVARELSRASSASASAARASGHPDQAGLIPSAPPVPTVPQPTGGHHSRGGNRGGNRDCSSRPGTTSRPERKPYRSRSPLRGMDQS